MTDYKLVPVEPTLDMLSAGLEAYGLEGCAETDILGIFKAMIATAPDVQGEPLRYTNDGALAECPCCGSLDVGGAHDTVHCYSCDLTVTKPRPLQNAIDAWNTRTGRTHPAPAVQGEPGVKWAPEEVANGNKGIRWVSDEGVHGRPTDHDCRVYLESNPNARGCHCPECTMLAAAPAVQGEPVGEAVMLQMVEGMTAAFFYASHVPAGTPLYTAPQPAEQERFKRFNGQECWMWAGDGSDRLETLTCPVVIKPAELMAIINRGSPSPDVTGLVEALKSMVSGYMRLLQSGYDRITDLGGDCDPVDVMERDDACLREARAAIAAHRKGGGK